MGLIARGIEESGLPTVFLGSCRDIMAQVRAPRNVFLDFPLGRQCGRPNDMAEQTNILKDALQTLATVKTPGRMVDLPYKWGRPFTIQNYVREHREMLEEKGETMQEWLPKK